jgi:hypothetical protein
MSTLKIAASGGIVHLIGENNAEIRLTAEFALELARVLPKFAFQAKSLTASDRASVLPLQDMSLALFAAGARWRLSDENPAVGWWEKGGQPLTAAADYRSATVRLYTVLIVNRAAGEDILQ